MAVIWLNFEWKFSSQMDCDGWSDEEVLSDLSDEDHLNLYCNKIRLACTFDLLKKKNRDIHLYEKFERNFIFICR